MSEQPNKEAPKSVHDILNETKPGRRALDSLVGPLFTSFWTDVLNMVFEWFPHEAGDGSENERAFLALRHRVLRVGNQNKRQMSMILEDFAVVQMRLRKATTITVPSHGAFALPEGVQMPPSKK